MKKQRLLIFLLLLLVIPAGFYTKFYTGPYSNWISNSMGGLVYEVFWCLVGAWAFPGARPARIAFLVFVFTGLIELSQISDTPVLEQLRSTFLGRTILGNSFNWLDFPYYAVGCLLGWLLLMAVKKMTAPTPRTSGQPDREYPAP